MNKKNVCKCIYNSHDNLQKEKHTQTDTTQENIFSSIRQHMKTHNTTK